MFDKRFPEPIRYDAFGVTFVPSIPPGFELAPPEATENLLWSYRGATCWLPRKSQDAGTKQTLNNVYVQPKQVV